ncbi:MAG TPA: hypothetical protein DHD79_04065 [Firmicutes bacterium]|jgi:hypothetical protein|nr:hypothetical protein [Bacillota bacterium]HAW72084.1 hypothetical protein [Bacillota bacterium]HAZ21822.1 hypothetical protein [Bacillota bacterium]HBG44362.1 hypothetical protein [Bacillota bacterium]HBL50412.1 hypothetical protein [Bacillota bacterium]
MKKVIIMQTVWKNIWHRVLLYGSVTGGLLSFGAGIILGWRVTAGGIIGVAIGLLNHYILGICALHLTEKGASGQPLMALGLYGRLILSGLAATAVIFIFGSSPVLAFLAGLLVIQIVAVAVETRLRGSNDSAPEGDDSNACRR